jgi:hypothetical protein
MQRCMSAVSIEEMGAVAATREHPTQHARQTLESRAKRLNDKELSGDEITTNFMRYCGCSTLALCCMY